HHVLEKMSEPAAALRLQPKADFVVDANGDHRSHRIRCNHDAQSVVQRSTFQSDLWSFHPCLPVVLANTFDPVSSSSSLEIVCSGFWDSTLAMSRFSCL